MKTKPSTLPFFGDPRVMVLLLVLAICSGYFTYNGALIAQASGEVDWTGHAAALIFAIASSTSIFLLWTAAPLAVSKLETPWMRMTGMSIVLISCLMIGALSSWFNVAGIAGDSALHFLRSQIISAFEIALGERYSAVQSIRALQPDLKQAKNTYLARRNAELERGVYSGRAGRGTTEGLLQTISQRFDEQDKAIDAALARSARVALKARATLTKMRKVAGRSGDPALRMENLARTADELRALLGELGGRSMLSGVQRTLQGLSGEIDLQAVSAKTKRGQKAQRDALKRIKAELGDTVAKLDAALQRHIDTPVMPIPVVERMNAIEAVWRYPLQHAPYWAGGIALDFTPTMLLLYAMLIAYARGRRGLFVDEVSNTTVRELVRAEHAKELLRDGRISHGANMQAHIELTGGPDTEIDDDVV